MAQKERDDGQEGGHGTDLQDAFRILSLAPEQRIRGLVRKEAPCGRAELLVRAMSLIVLGRGSEALAELQDLRRNGVASCLAEVVEERGGRLVDVGPGRTGDALLDLARVFEVLAREGLCGDSLRDRAFRVALLKCQGGTDELFGSDTSEVRCGNANDQALQQRADSIHSLKTDCLLEDRIAQMWPSSLRSTPSTHSSYPSRLEISLSTGDASMGDSSQTLLHRNDSQSTSNHTPNTEVKTPCRTEECDKSTKMTSTPGLQPDRLPAKMFLPCPIRPASGELVTSKSRNIGPDIPPPGAKRETSHPPTPPLGPGAQEPALEESEEALQFYSFVILHAQEDEDVAEEFKEKFEGMDISPGANFSTDFAVAGKSPLACLEDAIENSAFVILLLTRNYSSRMHELETNTALINAVENPSRTNSVIPLLPRKNSLPRECMPKVLRAIQPLYEIRKNFISSAKKAMDSAMVAKRKRLWVQAQNKKKQAQCPNPWLPYYPGPSNLPGCTNISINNAKCIMIGNNSTMTIGDPAVIEDEGGF
ncbi:TIR domain-containing adapter molecule 1 [Denticeps clupeoides]|uniref:TIR domain-containing adapter molecule 1 n=1 Tax=Denticeps clupeoides TaxID=299321 RepID=UPI0010A3DA98|nr:TIR domain-containing adapter molecule 1-like [Denticeps clupeoides]XP_028856298.1 TIR domain-containing adapter molecule 1-like [Denticeps clupeoides]